MANAVRRGQRFTAEQPCPVCGGYDKMPRGKGVRCFGYLGNDGKFAHCTREDLAGGLAQEKGGTFAHRLEGDCRCGSKHSDASIHDIEAARDRRDPKGERVVSEIVYDYEGGLRVIRRQFANGEKTFLQYHRNGVGYVPGRGDAPVTLYRAPELRQTSPEAFVFVVEGEKCVDNLRMHELVATTTPGGASGREYVGTWELAGARAAELLRGRHVVILPDNDEPGRGYAAAALRTIAPVAASVRMLELPGLDDAEDVVDWMRKGGEPEDLVRLAELRPDLVPERPGAIKWISTNALFEPLPPTQWVSQALGICPGRPTMIAGYGYSGKTLAGQALLLSFAAGIPAWGHFPPAQPMRVRHLDFEQGRHATLKRYQRLAAGMNLGPIDIAPRLEVAIFPPAQLNVKDAYDVYCRASEDWQMVLVDSFAGATPGEVENESKMRSHVDMLTRVSETTGATFSLIHHAGKPKDAHITDARTLIRGSSAIFDACGSVLVFLGEKTGPIKVIQVKGPAEAEGRAMDPFFLEIEDVPASAGYPEGVRVAHKDSEDQKGEEKAERETAQERRKAAYIARIERAVPEKMEQIWTALRKVKGHSITSRRDLEALVVGDTTVKQAAVTRLLAEGRVQRAKGDKEHWFEAV
jgi:AAA domain